MNSANFVQKRDELLISFENMDDHELLIKLIDLYSSNIPSSPEIARIALHKMRLYVPTIPDELKQKSKKWLKKHNYSESIFNGGVDTE